MSVQTDVKGALDSLVGSRVYPNQLPQNLATYPAMVYTVIADTPEVVLAGDTGLAQMRLQVDVYAETYDGAHTLAGSARSAIAALASRPVPLDAGRDFPELDRRLHRVTMDWSIWH